MGYKAIKKKIKNKRIFITGSSGFVGSWLTLTLNYFDTKILAYTLKKKDKKFISNSQIFKKKINTIFDDIINISNHEKKIKNFKPEIAIHLASQPLVLQSYKDTKETYVTNVNGTINFFETCKNISSIKKIIIFTSDKVYRNLKGDVLNENSPLGGIDPYSASKSCQDIIATSYKSSILKKNIEVVILRAGNIIGGGDWNEFRIIPDIFKSIYGKKKLYLRHPNAIRPWQHVFEIIKAIVIIMLKSSKSSSFPKIYNIAPNLDSNIKVLNLVNMIKRIGGYKNFIVSFKKKKNYESSILKLLSLNIKKDINYKPSLNLEKSIKLTIDWYKFYFSNKKNAIFDYSIYQIDKFFKNLKNK